MADTSTVRRRKHKARKRRGKLDLATAERAIYVDFEGNTGRPPVLLGVLVAPDENVQQYIVDERFMGFGGSGRGTYMDLESVVLSLVEKAESEGRRIVAWSEHDLGVVRNYCSPDLASRFAARYRNARMATKRWRKTAYPDLAFDPSQGKQNALSNYLGLIGYEVPEDLGVGRVGSHLRHLRGPAGRGRTWDELTVSQRRYWTETIGHNEHDCIGMFAVCIRATREIAASKRGADVSGSEISAPVTHDDGSETELNEMQGRGPAMKIGRYDLYAGTKSLRVRGQSASKTDDLTGVAREYVVLGPEVHLTLHDTVWGNGERDIRVVDRHASPPRFDDIVGRLRIGVRSSGPEQLELDVTQARPGRGGRLQRKSATLAELDEGAGMDVQAFLRRIGARLGVEQDGSIDTSGRLVCRFPSSAEDMPSIIFAITRIAPADTRYVSSRD